MSRLAAFCPDCDAPIPPLAVDVGDPLASFNCPACGAYGLREELKRKHSLTLLQGTNSVEDDMTDAQVREIIRQEMMGRKYLRLEVSPQSYGPVPTSIFSSANGFRSTGYSEFLRNLVREISLPVGANKIYERCLGDAVAGLSSNGPANQVTTWGVKDVTIQCLINPPTVSGSPTGETFIGIELGSFGITVPWQTGYTGASGPTVQFRYDYTNSRFEVCCWDQDPGIAPERQTCTLNPTFGPDVYAQEFKMVVSPNGGTNGTVKCYLSGTLVHTYQSARLDLSLSAMAATGTGPGFFVCNGSNAAISLTDCIFYELQVYAPDGILQLQQP